MSDPGPFAAAGAEEQEGGGGEPPVWTGLWGEDARLVQTGGRLSIAQPAYQRGCGHRQRMLEYLRV
jgi:hypothetical protein